MQFKDSNDGNYPGNIITIDIDTENLSAFRRSFKRAIEKARAWCRANSISVDASGLFGHGAKVCTTPRTGTLHVKLRNKGRELTLFFRGRDLYLKGWRSRFGLFAAHPHKLHKKDCFIQDPACKHLNIQENYNHLVPRGKIEKVRVGPFAMADFFEVLNKCNGIVTTDVLGAVAGFAINIPEPIRQEDVFEDILESFDNFELATLDSKRALSSYVRAYGHYSEEYLRAVDRYLEGRQVKILSLEDAPVKSLHELWRRIRVPLRSSYNEGVFFHDEEDDIPIWSPPC